MCDTIKDILRKRRKMIDNVLNIAMTTGLVLTTVGFFVVVGSSIFKFILSKL